MSIKIGHATADENNKLKGGVAGDSTKLEVSSRKWYAPNPNWNVVLRPKTFNIAEKMAKTMEAAIANNKIGYDQSQRDTLYTQAKKVEFDLSKITTVCECDCSSLMNICAIAAGVKISYGDGKTAFRTKNMVKPYLATGDFIKLTGSKYLTSDKYLRRGDILISEGKHTALVLEDGEYEAKNSIRPITIDAPTSFNYEYAGQYVVIGNPGLILREGPSSSKLRIGYQINGTIFTCFGQHTKDWLFGVTEDHQLGFCRMNYLKKKIN